MTSKIDEAPTLRKAKYAIAKGSMIGEGAYRKVYRTGKSRWVYKVDCNEDPYSGWWGTNDAELTNYGQYREHFSGKVRVPEMRLIGKDIIAAEYINGSYPAYCNDYADCECQQDELIDGECWYTVTKRAARGKIDDIHAGNVIIGHDGFIYIIDLGA